MLLSTENYFLIFLQHRKMARAKNKFFQLERTPIFFFQLPVQCATYSTFDNVGIIVIALANTGKLLKFQRIEIWSFSFVLHFLTAETGIILNLFLNFERK